ncbi:MAG: dihydroorotase [Rikenellaceae bacterium]
MKTLIFNGLIVNESQQFLGYIEVEDKIITAVHKGEFQGDKSAYNKTIDAKGGYVIPGVIDDQVHFREPGLEYKGEITTESRAAVAGGVTSYMEMPNTKPTTTTLEDLEWKFNRAAECSMANYSFYFGATNDNTNLLDKLDPTQVCGLKLFMGSSTGNMLVDRREALEEIFSNSPLLIATHCEEESIVLHNKKVFAEKYGSEYSNTFHPIIRSEEACYTSAAKAVELAEKTGARLHVLHISTAKELTLFSDKPLKDKKITSEICLHHLWFTDKDYEKKGNFILWNPAIKTEADRDGLREGVRNGKVDIIATDHAPHTFEEKSGSYPNVPSGGPLVQHSLVGMLELAKQGQWSVEKVVEKMCHAPSDLFKVEKRGYLKPGYFADIVVVAKDEWQVQKDNIYYKCGWSPFEGDSFSHKVTNTMINGVEVYANGQFNEDFRGEKLTFTK